MTVALVTGASSGMGKDIARALKADGHVVYGAARRVEQMADLEAEGITALRMDITVDDDIRSALAEIERAHGGVDVLVNNAGFGLYGPVEEVPISDARYQFEVNLFGLARLTQLVLPHMRAKRSGTIVNISSMGGKVYTPLGAWYHATKHALEGWSDCLRFELAPHGIDVVIVEPGAIETEWDSVMREKLVDDYSDGAYADLVAATARATAGAYGGSGSPGTVIARVVAKAVRARRPKTRYVAGKYARPMILLRRIVSDRMFDRLLRTQYR
ncbi:MAG: SDR family NAD(P)-dependent oxidoreductase [Thermoleophilia bacterium]|nr:SDR family NAD(P)-dependent oxidoreductase [Thermoleophilia bacterium]